ncbi:conserved Plasmodium protein, unknown function [Plasmodium chabaudi chabaudi]|uniref:Uncharacterized protein n=1 Tax=Plasmodium chabaudi chabaudi TaxID=31271 RepID=A0A4V0K2K9_PLACU|nr:conserved Plasmodium protein, unknown function [Plasmodium chabaudi chabaudi]VTZ67067.1 conserved Plasmodium protein, unknown function [Plasmodium chabaudi chabaudi]|eukprot:XP_746248.2 conserved Plasmodium protein, unknown function [Plasmodium chabaudi chabaudi]
MDFQRAIIKWVEKKKNFKIGKKLSHRKLYLFKKNAKTDILANLSNLNIIKDSTTIHFNTFQKSQTGIIKHENKYNDINCNKKCGLLSEQINNDLDITSCSNHNYMLKIIILNLKNVAFLLGRNDLQINRLLCHTFIEGLPPLHYKLIFQKNETQNNSIFKYITVEDIINLFNYYVYAKIYYYDFLNTLLRYIYYNFEDIKKENNIYMMPYKLSISFLKSCVNLKIQINKILKKNKAQKSFISCYGSLFLNSSSYYYLRNCITTKDGSSSLHSLSHQYSRNMKIANYHNKNGKSNRHKACVEFPLYKTVPYGFVDHFIKNNIKKKKYVHFFLAKKMYYKNLNYEKYTMRKYKNSMNNCVDLINKCISICLSVNIEKNQVVDYVKILQKKYMTYETWNILSIDKFNQQILDFLKKDISFFSIDDLIIIMKYFIKIEKNMHKKKKLKQLANYLPNSYLINNMHIKEEGSNGKLKKSSYINNYNIKQIKDLISILAKCKYRYNENLLTNISTYILENMHTISSKDLIQFIINMYIILKNKDSQFLYQIMNMYKPPNKPKRVSNEINDAFFKIKHADKQISYRMVNKNKPKNNNNCEIKNKFNQTAEMESHTCLEYQHDDKYFRVFEKNVKIKKLLLFIKILADNNIYINEAWSEYFIYLIKRKFNIIVNENLLDLLFHVLSHMQSRHIFSDFFFLNNINNKYNIYKNINLKKLPLFYDFPSLLQITLFLSFHIYNKYTFNVTRPLILTILDIYIKSSQRKFDPHEEGNKNRRSMVGSGNVVQYGETTNLEKNNLEQLAISCDHNFDKMEEKNFYVHDLKIYEKNKNNKYMKKKERKKKQALINKINKIDVNQIFTFEELKNYLLLHNHATSQEATPTEIISDTSNVILTKEKEKYVQVRNENECANAEKGKDVSLMHRPELVQDVFDYKIENGQNPSCKNFSLEKFPYGDTKQNEKRSKNIANEINKQTTVHSHSYKIQDINNSDHYKGDKKYEQTYRIYKNNNYFDKLAFSRNIIIIIYNLIFYFTNNSYISTHPSLSYHEQMLINFSYKDLKILYEAYTIASYYINLSLNIEEVMNNNKNISSSKMHKNILSNLHEMNLKKEIISEFILHPFKIDICIKK